MKIIKTLSLLVFSLFFLASCIEPFVIACRKVATDPSGEWKYTEEQAMAACAIADRYMAGKFNDGKGTWEINYRTVSVEDVLKYVQDQLSALDTILSYNNEETVRNVNFFKGFREGLEKQEKITRWIEHRLKLVINYNQFIDKIGQIDGKILQNLLPYGRKAYSLRLIYPYNDLSQLKFVADYVEAAKKEKILKLVNEFPIVEKKEFAEKIVDKNSPNKFTWKKHYRGWLIRAYKILPEKEPPASPNIDYLEIYKAKFIQTEGGKKFVGYEEQFAVAGFKARGKDIVNLFVINYNIDAVRGFSPDKILESYVDIIFGNEIYVEDDLRKEVMESLFEPVVPEEREHRKKPISKPIFAEVAKMGEVGTSIWENGDFSVPFSYSSRGPGSFEKNVDIIWDRAITPADKKIEEEQGLKKIKAFKIEYKKSGQIKIVEYYVPKSEYGGRNIRQGYAFGDFVRIQRSGYPEVSSGIDLFVDKVKIIDYEYGGRWYRIMDADGDGKFEKRQKIADPTKATTPF